MTLLLAGFWPGLAGAGALGLVVGALAGWPDRYGVPLGLFVLAGLLAAAAIAGFVPGVPGLWLDAAALLLPPYLVGCVLGALGRHLATRS
ncbi:hypothetical protein MMSR116_26480 [Methylobacterium mesophilicum SR1.6/6]|uniref:Uncharacterized protein n=1 Tax=Methylobacterium mesophilicum SR1.6/6 TaxID=908290 RepID=A0A6B9FVL9_9HYPH|nr:hypothetical protein [Methylobacterium mesophilicum]QGY05048.1 hypothetical protein MMSR116_26480 [Methylobacterium mesophilicum SR1.6/6]